MPRAPVTVFSFPVAETLCQLLAHEPLLPGIQGLLDGPWLFAGVLGGLIIRKAETTAASSST